MDTEHNCVWDGDRRFLQSRRKRSRYQVWSSGYWRVRLQAWWNKGMVENSSQNILHSGERLKKDGRKALQRYKEVSEAATTGVL